MKIVDYLIISFKFYYPFFLDFKHSIEKIIYIVSLNNMWGVE